MRKRVVITGLGVVSSIGIGWREFWQNLLAGKSGISPVTSIDTSKHFTHNGGYFDDVEVRRSRSKGISCRVTLTKGDQSYVGEAEGMGSERSRIELAARAALRAIVEGDPTARPLDLGGTRVVDAFDREFVFVAVSAQMARESALLTGTCEVKDSPETASVLAVLDATNRWLALPRRA